MAQGSFSATVSDWVKETKARQVAVYRGSAQALVAIMQTPRNEGGNLRIETGFLRSSLVANIGFDLPSPVPRPKGVTKFPYNAGPVNLTIKGARISDPISVAYAANYSRPREYGSRGQPGDRWVGLAAQRWPQVVEQESAKAKASVASRAGG